MENGEAPADPRSQMARLLSTHYQVDPGKAVVLAALLRSAAITSYDGNLELRAGGLRLAEISPLGTRRFFDLKGRWILTLDPAGFVLDEFRWDSEGHYETGWTWNPQMGRLELKAVIDEEIRKMDALRGLHRNPRRVRFVDRIPSNAYACMMFEPGLDFDDMCRIPFARIDHEYGAARIDISGLGLSVMRVVSLLAQDQGCDLTYSGNDTDPLHPDVHARLHLYNTLSEVADPPQTIIDSEGHEKALPADPLTKARLFEEAPQFFPWKPNPPQVIVHSKDLVVYLRAGRADRVYYHSYFFQRAEYRLRDKAPLLTISKMPNEVRDMDGGQGLFLGGEHVATLDSRGHLIWDKYPDGLLTEKSNEPVESDSTFYVTPLISLILQFIGGDFGTLHPGNHPEDLEALLGSLRGSATRIATASNPMALLCLVLLAIKSYHGYEGAEQRGSAYCALATQRLKLLQSQLLPAGKPRARAVIELFGVQWYERFARNQEEPQNKTWMDHFLFFCLTPARREFVGQWERDYAEQLSGLPALRLEEEWQRLASLRHESVTPLYQQSFASFQAEAAPSFHPVFFGKYRDRVRDVSTHVHLQRDLLLSLAMMNVFLEWASRHWNARSLGSAVRGLPKANSPGDGYIRECLRTGMYPADPLTADILARIIHAISRELADSLLDLTPSAGPAGEGKPDERSDTSS